MSRRRTSVGRWDHFWAIFRSGQFAPSRSGLRALSDRSPRVPVDFLRASVSGNSHAISRSLATGSAEPVAQLPYGGRAIHTGHAIRASMAAPIMEPIPEPMDVKGFPNAVARNASPRAAKPRWRSATQVGGISIVMGARFLSAA